MSRLQELVAKQQKLTAERDEHVKGMMETDPKSFDGYYHSAMYHLLEVRLAVTGIEISCEISEKGKSDGPEKELNEPSPLGG